jgi:hypothetical protein
MTSPSFLDSSAPDIEMLVAAWLAPLRRSGVAFRTGDPLPFTLVTRIGGDENFWTRLDEPIVSVHTLCDLSKGYAQAGIESQATHDRMLELGWALGPVLMPDGSQVCVDYLKPFQYPRWLDYEDVRVLRKVGRYKIGTTHLRNGV